MPRKVCFILIVLISLSAAAQKKVWEVKQNILPENNSTKLGEYTAFTNGYVFSSSISASVEKIEVFKKSDTSGLWEKVQSLEMDTLGTDISLIGFTTIDSSLYILGKGKWNNSNNIEYRINQFNLTNLGDWVYKNAFKLPYQRTYTHLGLAAKENHIAVACTTRQIYSEPVNTISGAVYIFKESSVGWTLQDSATESGAKRVDAYGYKIQWADSFLIVGAPYSNYNSEGLDFRVEAGLMYVYKLNGDSKITTKQTIELPNRRTKAHFGASFFIKDNRLYATGRNLYRYRFTDSNLILERNLYSILSSTNPGGIHHISDKEAYLYLPSKSDRYSSTTGLLYIYSINQLEDGSNSSNYVAIPKINFTNPYNIKGRASFQIVENDLIFPTEFLDSQYQKHSAIIVMTAQPCVGDTSNFQLHRCNPFYSISEDFLIDESGIYLDSITTDGYCTKYYLMNVDLGEPNDTVISIDFCKKYTSPNFGISTTESKLIIETMTNASGCDSIIYIEANRIGPRRVVNLNNGVLVSGDTMMKYQWYDCLKQKDIDGETESTFRPREEGLYALKIFEPECDTTITDCISISQYEIVYDTTSYSLIYPNPTAREITIDWRNKATFVSINLYDIHGELIDTWSVVDSYKTTLTLNLKSGVYFIQINSPGLGLENRRIVVY